ncbi:hypothetical protein SAMN05720465_0086 [Fibrobacter sp. UWB10]|nr:hypothetical protein SAMN05720465_0086 [Fibrobacter sp. UWB10]
MFYKHWKKIALTLTALFWASCSETHEEAVLYGCPPDDCYDEPESSDSNNDESSSSEKTISSSSETASSSSETSKPESSETANTESSSSESIETESSSSEAKSSSSEITCVPLDSTVSYFTDDYNEDLEKLWSKQAAQHDAAKRIDSIKTTLAETPMCLENLRMELERFVALYGAPIDIKNAVDSCSDGTIRPSEEYAKFLKMQEEWEANKPALDAECKKVYEDKLKEIEARINKCLSGETEE